MREKIINGKKGAAEIQENKDWNSHLLASPITKSPVEIQENKDWNQNGHLGIFTPKRKVEIQENKDWNIPDGKIYKKGGYKL